MDTSEKRRTELFNWKEAKIKDITVQGEELEKRFHEPEIEKKLNEIMADKTIVQAQQNIIGRLKIMKWLYDPEDEHIDINDNVVRTQVMDLTLEKAVETMLNDAEKWDLKAAILETLTINLVQKILFGILNALQEITFKSLTAREIMGEDQFRQVITNCGIEKSIVMIIQMNMSSDDETEEYYGRQDN